MVKLLCKYGADLDKIAPNGSTALYVAAQNGFADVLDKFTLIDHFLVRKISCKIWL